MLPEATANVGVTADGRSETRGHGFYSAANGRRYCKRRRRPELLRCEESTAGSASDGGPLRQLREQPTETVCDDRQQASSAVARSRGQRRNRERDREDSGNF